MLAAKLSAEYVATLVETDSADTTGPTDAEEMTEQDLVNTITHEAASSGDVEQAVDTGDLEQAVDYGDIESAVNHGVNEQAAESVMNMQEPDRVVNQGMRRPHGRLRLRIRSDLGPSLNDSGSPPWRRPRTPYQSTTRPRIPTRTTTTRLHDDVGSYPASPEEEVDEREMTQSGEEHSPEGSPSSPPLHIPVFPFVVADDEVVPRARKPALRRPEAVAANQDEDNSSEDPDALHIQFDGRLVRAWTEHARNISVPVVLVTQEHRRLHREFCMRFERNIEETFHYPPHPPHLLVRDYPRHPQSDDEVRDEVLESLPLPERRRS